MALAVTRLAALLSVAALASALLPVTGLAAVAPISLLAVAALAVAVLLPSVPGLAGVATV